MSVQLGLVCVESCGYWASFRVDFGNTRGKTTRNHGEPPGFVSGPRHLL